MPCISFALCLRLARHKAKIPAARLVAKAGQLAPVIKDLQTLCNKADAKAVNTESEAAVFKTAISQILTCFSNTKLKSKRAQPRRSNSRISNYTYVVAVNEVKIENYKQPDPFTQAVIELLKPRLLQL